MTKTPYELRMELLNFSQFQLTGEYHAALERAREIKNDDWREAAIKELKYPLKEDIIFLAEDLKSFVDKK
jgi:hypothetical protein